MNRARAGAVLALLALLGAASTSSAGEAADSQENEYDEDYVTPEEQRERELETRRQAQAVLVCDPGDLRAAIARGETKTLHLTIRNAGGQTLNWAVTAKPDWLRVDAQEGSLGFEEERRIALDVETGDIAADNVRGELVLYAPGAAGSPATIVVLLDIKPKLPPPPEESVERRPSPPERPQKERGKPFGVHAGMLLPASGESAEYDSNLFFGLHFRSGGRNGAKVSYEFAVDVGTTEVSGGYESRPVAGVLNLLVSTGGSASRTRGCLIAGAGGVMELVEETGSGTGYTNYAGTVSLGAGLLLGGGRFELRAAYNMFLGSDNVGGRAVVALGYGF